MPRTAITVANLSSYATAATITQTNGDAANDHSIDGTKSPKLILRAQNTNGGAAVAFTLELAAGSSTFNQAVSLSYSVPASGIEVILLDIPSDALQSGNVIHLDSADANFADMRFEAYTWN